MQNYLDLLEDIHTTGHSKGDRTGTGTKSTFGKRLEFDLQKGFPLLTTRKISLKVTFVELMWFIQGRTDLRYLLERNVHIWTGDMYKRYVKAYESLEFPYAEMSIVRGSYLDKLTVEEFEQRILENDEFNARFGDCGPIYGSKWRDFSGIDQLKEVIERLKEGSETENLDCRRLLVSAWDPSVLKQVVLPPCHLLFQFYSRELDITERTDVAYDMGLLNEPRWFEDDADMTKWLDDNNVAKRALSLQWYQRSVDSCLGLPTNIASYALLTMMVAKVNNMAVEKLYFVGGDTHIYNDHLEQSLEQIARIPGELPTLKIKHRDNIEDFQWEDLTLENYVHQEQIKYKLSN